MEKPLKKLFNFSNIYFVLTKDDCGSIETWSGDDGEEVTPVPMPNTEVKLFSANGNWGLPPVRVGRRRAKPFSSY